MAIRSFPSSSHLSSQIHRLTSFGDVEITALCACSLAGFCPAGGFVGLFCLGKAGSCRRDVTDRVGYKSFVNRCLWLLVLLYVLPVRTQAF